MEFDKYLIGSLFEKAFVSSRLRINQDLRTSELDGSQRMLNAVLPGTAIPIHRHLKTSETVICLCGKMDEVFYDDNGNETKRIHLCPTEEIYGCQVPKAVWHTVEVFEPSVIFEAKDFAYGNDDSEIFDDFMEKTSHDSSFENSLGDLKKNIEYLIGLERQSGSIEVISPLYVSRMLNVPLEEVEACMKGKRPTSTSCQ